MMLVAFDSLASDKAGLERLFRLLTTRIAFLTAGGPAPETPNPRLPPMDSGILGPFIAPDNLTITVSLGESMFDARYGLAQQKPKALQKMTRFPNDSLDANLCHGDLLLQICANTQDTVIHALRDIIKHTPDLLSVRWKREGFISDHAARSKGKETPVNLLGFKDGTANPDSRDGALMKDVVWVTADQGEPAGRWAAAIRPCGLSSSTLSSGIVHRSKSSRRFLVAINKAVRRWVCSTSMMYLTTPATRMAMPLRWTAISGWRTRARRRHSPA